MDQNQDFTASGETIKENILRLWGTISNAEKVTGLSRSTLHRAIRDGEINNPMIGHLVKIGIDPKELVREVA